MSPVGPATELSVIVPLDGVPPATVVGLKFKEANAAALTVNWAEAVLWEPREAVIVRIVCALTAFVPTVKVADVWPEATVTDTGVVAAALLLLRVTTVPFGAAGPLRVTKPVDEVPPRTALGVSVRPVTVGELIVRVGVSDWPLSETVIFAVVWVFTPVVVTLKVPVVLPEVIVMVDGTLAAAVLLERAMTVPAEGAGPLMVTVPVKLVPPRTAVGLRIAETRAGG